MKIVSSSKNIIALERADIKEKSFRNRRNYYLARLINMTYYLQRVFASKYTKIVKYNSEKNIAILGSAHIGDLLWRTASLKYLKQKYPEYKIFYFVNSSTKNILEYNPYVIPLEIDYTGDFVADLLKEVKALRKRRIEIGISTDRYGYERKLYSLVLAGVEKRISYIHKGFAGLTTMGCLTDEPLTYPAYFRSMVEGIINERIDDEIRPEIFVSDSDINECRRFKEELGLDDRKYFGVFNTAITSNNVFDDEVIVSIVQNCIKRYESKAVLLGSVSDKRYLCDLASRCGDNSVVAAGWLGIRALSVLLKESLFVITPDSGPRHIANSSGSTVYYLEPDDGQLREEVGPYVRTETLLSKELGSASRDLSVNEKISKILDIIYKDKR